MAESKNHHEVSLHKENGLSRLIYITPSALPTLVNAAIALSKWC